MAASASSTIHISTKPSTPLSWKTHFASSPAFAVFSLRGHRQYPRFVIFAMGAKPTVLVAEKLGEAGNIAQADASVKAGKWLRNKYVGVS
ncbi:hypothetical protein HAX54_010428 [Datura stramonium]|uniref:Uncharacterized protein n=1 Tax=Datura stramonium TaxID=4076 RepID=A0ABS8WVX0_DATST|nr:hypothetical protein [Datura stramonium]